MRMRYVTRNSTYEVEGLRIRRVSGTNPSVLPVPDGEWIETDAIEKTYLGPGQVLYASKDGKGLILTSTIEAEEPADECDTETPAPEPCEAIERIGNYFDPPTYCDEDAIPGSVYCQRHAEEIE